MKNYFHNYSLNIIRVVFCNGRIFSMILYQWYSFLPNPKYIFDCKGTGFSIYFFVLFCFVFCIWCFVNGIFIFRLNVQYFSFSCINICTFWDCPHFFAMFLAHSFNESILCLSCDLFCDEPASFCINFLLQFSFSELSVMFKLFSSKVKPCCNLLKCFSHSVIAISVFLCICVIWEINCVKKCQKLLFIGFSLCLIIWSNCLTFCIGNFCDIRNPFAIAFLYTNIWIVCGIIF